MTKEGLKTLAIELAAVMPPLPPPSKNELIDRIDEINPKLAQAAAIADLIQAAYQSGDIDPTSIIEGAKAAETLINEARSMLGKMHLPTN